MKTLVALPIAGALLAAMIAGVADAATLDTVKARGKLICGVNPGLLGFSSQGPDGKWAGFDVDFCRAVSAAIFGDPDKVEYMPVSTGDRFKILGEGKIDLLSRNATWTMSRVTDLGLTFVGVTYYDGQGFLVPAGTNVVSSLELGGSKVCVQGGTTTEANLADYFSANNMPYEAVVTKSAAESLEAYTAGRCTVITSDISQLYAERLKLADPGAHTILPDAISKEPLSPAVRQDDPAFATLVSWVVFALINAEEMGVSSETMTEALASTKPDVRRLVGNDGTFGEQMSLGRSWAADMIRTVGNYGEIYERNLGVDTDLGIPRGMNQLWSRGGIQYAPPIR